MTKEEAKSCKGTIELLQRLAYNIHGVMDVIDADNCKKIIKALEQEPITKNDLGVDAISRAQAQTKIEMNASRYTIARECGGMGQVEWSDQLIKVSDAVDIIRHLPSVTPQDIDYKAQYERFSKKADIIISQLRADRDRLMSLSSVRPKGHWIKIGDRGFGYSDIVICKCSECEYQTEFVGKFDGHNIIVDTERADNYCSNCGADMREVEE